MASILLLVILAAVSVSALLRHAEDRASLAVLILAGVASFIPGVPRLELEPEIILSLVMPPLLYSAALHFSFFRFMRNLRPILGLGVGLVVVTTFAVGGVAAWIAPGIGTAGAFVLAAVVSPPDTVTVVTRGRRMGLPRRVVTILTGESLVNDAAALTILAITVTAVTGEHVFISQPVLLFLYEAVVGCLVGFGLGLTTMFVRTALRNPTLETTFSVLMPFTAFLVAEQVHASGVLAVVVAGFAIAVHAAFPQPHRPTPTMYRTRLQEAQVWPVLDTLLEAFVYAYMGLQLQHIITDLRDSGEPIGTTVLLALVTLAAVMLVRVAWVFVVFGRGRRREYARHVERQARWQERLAQADERAQRRSMGEHAHDPEFERRWDDARRRRMARPPEAYLGWRELLLVSWTGMRGIVTLAAAASIPLTTETGPFPGRETIQFVAFTVAIGTLLIQGLTLPWLARRVNIDLSAEIAEEREHLEQGRALIAAHPADAYDARREAITMAVVAGDLDDDVGRVLIRSVDLAQATAASE